MQHLPDVYTKKQQQKTPKTDLKNPTWVMFPIFQKEEMILTYSQSCCENIPVFLTVRKNYILVANDLCKCCFMFSPEIPFYISHLVLNWVLYYFCYCLAFRSMWSVWLNPDCPCSWMMLFGQRWKERRWKLFIIDISLNLLYLYLSKS